jgi:hypothetical protein
LVRFDQSSLTSIELNLIKRPIKPPRPRQIGRIEIQLGLIGG